MYKNVTFRKTKIGKLYVVYLYNILEIIGCHVVVMFPEIPEPVGNTALVEEVRHWKVVFEGV